MLEDKMADRRAEGFDVQSGIEKKGVTRFQAFQAFTDAEHFAYSIWSIVHRLKTREEFKELLNSEFTEEELQLLVTAAREGRYPVSLERLQFGIEKYERTEYAIPASDIAKAMRAIRPQ